MLKWDGIEVFVQVVQNNGFSAAAKSFGISTSAVSQQIKQLEERCGLKLLNRTTRKITLTSAGEKYYLHCKRLLDEMNVLESFTKNYLEEPQGILRVTYGNYMGERYLMSLLPEFVEQYPKITLDLRSGEHFEQLQSGETDLLFGMIAPEQPNWVRRRVLDTRYVVCATPDYFKKYGTPKKPEDLHQHRYITHTRRAPPMNALSFKNDQQILLDPILLIDDGRDMIACAKAGLGIIKTADFMIVDEIKSGHLQEVLKEYAEPKCQIYLYYLKNKYLDPKIRCFIDYMMDNITRSDLSNI